LLSITATITFIFQTVESITLDIHHHSFIFLQLLIDNNFEGAPLFFKIVDFFLQLVVSFD